MSSPNPNCPLCHGTGGYAYDENHSTACRLCCTHARWYIQTENHTHPGEITCTMCGYEARHEPWRVFDPSEVLEAEVEYRILWSKVPFHAPHMPAPKLDRIVREGSATFGRSSKRGQVAHVQNGDRLVHKDTIFEVDPGAVIAIMRLV